MSPPFLLVSKKKNFIGLSKWEIAGDREQSYAQDCLILRRTK